MKKLLHTISFIIMCHAIVAQNTGFGTNTPHQKLEVAGNMVVRDSLGIGTTAPHGTLHFGNVYGNKKIVMWEDAVNNHNFYGFGINNNMLRYQVTAAGADHVFFAGKTDTSSVELMRIKGNGNVGIGTAAPAYKLDVNGSVRFGGDVIVTGNNPGGTWLYLTNSSGTPTGWKLITSGAANPGQPGSLFFYNDENSAQFTMLQNGNVGIGITEPTNKLEVNGNSKINGDLTVTGNLNIGYTYLYEDYDIDGSDYNAHVISCPSGTAIISGGGGHRDDNSAASNISTSYNGPDPSNPLTKWKLTVVNHSLQSRAIRIFCTCAKIQ